MSIPSRIRHPLREFALGGLQVGDVGDAEARERVRNACLDFIRATGVQSVEANVLYASAKKRLTGI